MAEGRTFSYEKAELAAKLMDLKFEEEDAIYAANECGSLYMAISYLQQDCELCASKYGVKEVFDLLIMNFLIRAIDYFFLLTTDGVHVALHPPLLSWMR